MDFRSAIQDLETVKRLEDLQLGSMRIISRVQDLLRLEEQKERAEREAKIPR